MGCVLGREASLGVGNESKEERREVASYERKNRNLSVELNDTVKVDSGNNAGGLNRVGETKEEKVETDLKPKGERRRSKPNPRLGNPPRHKYGEQVAAGWPSWLSAHVGEAIEGWNIILNMFFEENAPMMILDPLGGRMSEISETEIPFPHRKGICTTYNTW